MFKLRSIGARLMKPAAIAATAMLSILAASHTKAAVVAYDGFNYTVPGSLNGQNGGSGFSGAWTASGGLVSPALATGSLTYTSGSSSLLTVGNKVAPTSGSRSIRVFSSPIATANTTMWLSYRINQTGTGTLPSNHAGFSLFTNADATGTEILFGKGTNWTNWGMLLSTGGSATKAGSVTAADRNGMLLYKCVFTTTTVTIQMWVNPVFTESGLGAAHATLPATSYSGSLACLRVSTGTNSTNYQFDEIRIGTTFNDVMPATTGNTFTPTTSSALTTALGQAQLGDTIILQAGTLYEGSFQLPNKTSGSGYITIQSSNLASLPTAGTRVNLSHASNMPKIRAANTTSSPFYTATSAHHFKLIGLEITGPVPDTQPDGVTDIGFAPVQLGTVGVDQDTLAEVPHNIIIDRCIIRANSNTQRIRRGIALHSASTDILNCHISGFKDVDLNDTQAIGGYNGPGPYNIINNYLEGAGENIMFGGDNISIPNLIPSDIVIAKNHFFKPLNWKVGHATYDGSDWVIKVILELKVARNMLIEGNIFENCWNQGQSGYGVTFSVRNQNGSNNWAVVENVTYRKNILRNSGGFYFIGSDPNHPSQPTNHITLENNLNYNINSAFAGTGNLYAFGDGPAHDITINHNTSFHDGNVISNDVSDYSNFVFTNNLQAHNGGIIAGGGTGAGTLNMFNGLTFQKNVLMDNASHSLTTLLNLYNPYHGGWNPTSLMFPQNGWTGVVVNQASPGSNFAGYKVVGWDQPTNMSLYPYNNTGTDGKDIGCNIDEVVAATAGCVSGVWSSNPTTKTFKNGVNGYTGATSFYVSGASPTTNFDANRFYMTNNSFVGTNGSVLRSFYKFDLNQGANAIPSGSTIVSAKLRMKLEMNSGTTQVGVHRVTPTTGFTVNYATATRNTYNGTNQWTGGTNAGDQDHAATADSSLVPPAVGQWMEFDVKNSVQAFVNGTANNGWVVKTVGGTIRTSTPSDSSGSAEYTELVVEYQ